MTYITTFIDNNVKSAVYTRGNIHGLYCYQEMIGAPKKLTTSGQRSHNFDPKYSIHNDIASLQPVIEGLHMMQKSIFKFCGRIGHNDDDCIIHGHKLISPILKRKMNQFSALCGDEPNEPPI